jgi:hypothetical protein
MAASSLIPKNGAVAIGTMVADFASFEIESKQSVETVTPYGTNLDSKNVGNGTADFTVNVGAFAEAHSAATALGMPTLGATGSTCTFTLDTGVTEAGTFIIESMKVSHARMRGAVPLAITLRNAGDVTEAWIAS